MQQRVTIMTGRLRTSPKHLYKSFGKGALYPNFLSLIINSEKL